jgi:beta-ribofuranosylaminobenzene 5'-phosphate synthase
MIEKAIPAHAGLGSGTQIALAVAAAMRRVHHRPLDVEGDAVALGRGNRSGVGIGLFRTGGLVVDGGRGPSTTVPPVVSRMTFPDQWRMLIVLDPAREGAHGPGEAAAFAALPPFPPERAADNCRLVLMQALPALAERDLIGFASAIAQLQSRIGDYFAPIQAAGRFNSALVAEVLAAMAAEGAVGIGQSSWGPTGFAFAASDTAAERMLQMRDADPRFRGLDIQICRGLNRGAQIGVCDALASGQA